MSNIKIYLNSNTLLIVKAGNKIEEKVVSPIY